MDATLYGIPGCPFSTAARLMLEHKGIPHRYVDLPQGVHRLAVRTRGFEGQTVPALSLDGRRVQGTRTISREIDVVCPDPPLLPADPAARAAAEDAERFGEEALGPIKIDLLWWALARRRDAAKSFLDGSRMAVPAPVARGLAPAAVWLLQRLRFANPEVARATLAAVPETLDRVDDLIAAGVLDGADLGSADYIVGMVPRMLMCFDDLRPLIAGRPAESLALRVCPEFPGRVPPVFAPHEMPRMSAAAGAAL